MFEVRLGGLPTVRDRERLAGQLHQPGGRAVAVGEVLVPYTALDWAARLEAAAALDDGADEPAGTVDVPLLLTGGADAGELKADVGHWLLLI